MSLARISKEEVLPIGMILLMFVFGLVLEPNLPAQLPTHWDVHGVPIQFLPRDFVIYFWPGFILAVYLLLFRLPLIDPLRRGLTRSANALFWIRASTVLFLLGLYVFFLGATIGVWPAYINDALTIGFSYLFFMYSRHLPQMKRNYFYGIVTPWTLESNSVWKRTHELAGHVLAVMAVGNLVGLLIGGWSFWWTVALIVGGLAYLSSYASRIYNEEFPHGSL